MKITLEAKFGPGKYYIGDICYMMDDDIYHDTWGRKFNYEAGVFPVKDTKFAVANTAYGDGGYQGSDGREYSVDAGVIGVVPEILWSKEKGRNGDGGRIVEVKKELIFKTDEAGLFEITIDNEELVIDTND